MRTSFVSFVQNRYLLADLAYAMLDRSLVGAASEAEIRSIVSTLLADSDKSYGFDTVDGFLQRIYSTELLSLTHARVQWRSADTQAYLAALELFGRYYTGWRRQKADRLLQKKAELPQWHKPVAMMSYHIWKEGQARRMAKLLATTAPSLASWYHERLEGDFFDAPWFERRFLGGVAWPLGDVPFWKEALKDSDRDTRRQAALVIGTARVAESAGPLLTILGDDDDQVRAWGAWALGRLIAVDAVGLLTSLLEDPSGRVRFQARRALALIQGEGETELTEQVLTSRAEVDTKVLVSDDDLTLLDVYRLILERAGYKVLCTPGGEQTLELARREPPALVITDRMNINLNGTDLIFELRGETPTREIPIVVISAEPPDWLAFFWGADIFLQKPFDPGELTPLIDELLAD